MVGAILTWLALILGAGALYIWRQSPVSYTHLTLPTKLEV